MIEKIKTILDEYGWNYPVIVKVENEKITEVLISEEMGELQMGAIIAKLPAVDVLLKLEKQEKPEGLQYIRDLINEYSEYIKIKSLLPSVGISSSNYYVFRAGSDSHLSEEKAVALFKTLLRRPIK